ncbi:PCYCGC motif-containing (lipo)protein [Aneurinibacillus sp. REN35]|uniref:PCYCGC motif-containing (lipo)protein n=1 Tax=Aneurinibacillus sp. REN35 TaxID=3237286 RepID=UPI003528E0CC
MFKRFILTLFLLLLSLFAVACTSSQAAQEKLPNGDTLETTDSIHNTPQMLTNTDGSILHIYKLALEHQEIMKQVPVYDGSDYPNILEAFLYKINPDGKIVWNSHGSTSGKAIAVATDTIALSQAGKPLQEIQQVIAKKYGEEYGADSPRRNYQ